MGVGAGWRGIFAGGFPHARATAVRRAVVTADHRRLPAAPEWWGGGVVEWWSGVGEEVRATRAHDRVRVRVRGRVRGVVAVAVAVAFVRF